MAADVTASSQRVIWIFIITFVLMIASWFHYVS